MKLSAVIISYNQLSFIRRLTEQLLDQDFAPDDYEIVIVECASSDGSRAWLKNQGDRRVRAIFLTDPSNRSFARNRGIQSSVGEVVVMIDGDHTVQRNFLTVHWQAHTREVCAVVGKSDFAHHPDYLAINTYLNGGGAAKLPTAARLPGRYFLTRNCSAPRSVLLQIGLFDESFEKWGGEDLDLGVRLEEVGVPIYGEPDALAIHHHFRDVRSLMANVEAYGRDGVPILLRKHPRLFREMNLDRLFSNPFEANRFTSVHRALMNAVCAMPIYGLVLRVAHMLRRRRLPRFVFDYLHLRQYALGFQSSPEFRNLLHKP